ncbi:MAG TPA: hypothetical protein DGJ56_08100, partial [Verrucomicrobiales bacterium]|nr:hypothetical protein [Verrucomicrobiales bacterium]
SRDSPLGNGVVGKSLVQVDELAKIAECKKWKDEPASPLIYEKISCAWPIAWLATYFSKAMAWLGRL